ncbi:MAG: SDR family oxidoreductase [Spirochaetota bacterium]|nr:SDR family oxidoreductase [Spirochaetota bacterium]
MRKALITGGTGAIGRAVIEELADLGVEGYFTYHSNNELAGELEKKYPFRSVKLDFREPVSLRDKVKALFVKELTPDILIHCAGIGESKSITEISHEDWLGVCAVNAQSVFLIIQELVPKLIKARQGDIILLGALDRCQSIKLPVHYSVSQGMLSSMAMAVAKELGSHNIKINMVASGLLDSGLSSHFDDSLHQDYLKYSCLKRKGKAHEVAAFVSWLAMNNTYISGKVIPVNGGI